MSPSVTNAIAIESDLIDQIGQQIKALTEMVSVLRGHHPPPKGYQLMITQDPKPADPAPIGPTVPLPPPPPPPPT